ILEAIRARELAVKGVEAPVFLVDHDDVSDPVQLVVDVLGLPCVAPVGKRARRPGEQDDRQDQRGEAVEELCQRWAESHLQAPVSCKCASYPVYWDTRSKRRAKELGALARAAGSLVSYACHDRTRSLGQLLLIVHLEARQHAGSLTPDRLERV